MLIVDVEVVLSEDVIGDVKDAFKTMERGNSQRRRAVLNTSLPLI